MIIDELTSFLIIAYCGKTKKADYAFEQFWSKFVLNYGLPESVILDKGFGNVDADISKSPWITQLEHRYRVKVENRISNYPSSLPLVENVNNFIGKGIEKMVKFWNKPELLEKIIAFLWNSQPTVSGISPFELVYGKNFSMNLTYLIDKPSILKLERLRFQHRVHREVRRLIRKNKAFTIQHEMQDFDLGDAVVVMLYGSLLTKQVIKMNKTKVRWHGPYIILDIE